MYHTIWPAAASGRAAGAAWPAAAPEAFEGPEGHLVVIMIVTIV